VETGEKIFFDHNMPNLVENKKKLKKSKIKKFFFGTKMVKLVEKIKKLKKIKKN